jgi:predicted permease
MIAIASLAVGIGANTAVFTLVNAVILGETPIERIDEVVEVYRSTGGFSHATFSYPDFEDLRRDHGGVFAELAASRINFVQADAEGGVEMMMSELISGNFFPMLGIEAAIGRTFLPSDDVSRGGHPVVMLGYGTWQKRYDGDPAVIGRSIRLNGREYSIIGVVPKSWTGNIRGMTPEIYGTTMMMGPLGSGEAELDNRSEFSTFLKARLAPGVSLVEAQSAVDRFAGARRQDHPDHWQADSVITLVPTGKVIMNPMIDRILVPAAIMLIVIMLLVLTIACANLGSFLLAQAVDRRKEVATRLALGAARSTLIRQWMTESLLLALGAGAVGLILARSALWLLVNADLPLPVPLTLDLEADTTVLALTFLVSLVSGVFFGLAPALQATRPDIVGTLKDESAGGGQAKKIRLRNTLVVVQVAVSAILLVGAGLFLRSLGARLDVDPGFGQRPAAILTVFPSPERYTPEEAAVFQRALIAEATARPGVESAGLVGDLPLNTLANHMVSVKVPGVDPPPGHDHFLLDYTAIDPGLFDAASLSLLEGRGFDERDRSDSTQVAIVSRAFVDRFWPGQNALDRSFTADGVEVTVVGVSRDATIRSLGETPRPFLFRPFEQEPNSSVTLVARTRGPAEAVLLDLVAVARRLDPELMILESKTMKRHLDVMLLPQRLSALVVGTFGGLALMLASIGLYGVVSYTASSRYREVGIRVALGADPASVSRLLMGGGMKLVALGAGIGLAISALMAQLLGGLLYGVGTFDPVAFGLVPLVLGAVAFAAAWIPARRASTIDPVTALHSD